MNKKVVLIRHGESLWNKLNKFTGWTDIELSEKGILEAVNAAYKLSNQNFIFDIAYTSYLKRAIHTLWIILKKINHSWIPVNKTWKLNERHYGALQGLNKDTTALQYGEKEVYLWRRSFIAIPPKVQLSSKFFPGNDVKYLHVNPNILPTSESLQCTQNRVIPYWKKIITKTLKQNKRILIVAHGNSLRALIKYLNKIDDEKVVNLDIPTGHPIIYEFDENFKPLQYYFL
ncbi:2,3-bisphosphoglycerate-dependent phosphoglycerate mutase [Buchnera aphidicola (Nipponaphis monzeni)]|uniref:2,3-bisphosphoglycerate-dependent phosphoglycerate mutase n=1 Tax=Buchnera aphidicola (Nipponaphis monzeni) TaxID=2495405 RepID=A0A455TA88_9GAMM|nr:2,3-diphosphoglycerate-dependent phosphoglycerate mutase [Buchnera aphidicola]BBI01248.1 2,3-bisphosphoglycerate-dependent phosphoglycerate mutase [Buchnera aphidicola (Nipponaphis monzeni)]